MRGDGADVVGHFTARADRYDASSRWCTDQALLDRIFEASGAGPQHRVLDVACGTGLVSERFHGRVAELVGVDLTPAMAEQAKGRLDRFVQGSAHALPFADASFDVVVCRQGIQFMDLPLALSEMVRVLRPGGRLVTADLHAYGPGDAEHTFEILRLRNPARRNFFVAGDLEAPILAAGCSSVSSTRFVSVEDVDAWADNGAIQDARREAIRAVYRAASPDFLRLHHVEVGDRIVDHMLFLVTMGLR